MVEAASHGLKGLAHREIGFVHREIGFGAWKDRGVDTEEAGMASLIHTEGQTDRQADRHTGTEVDGNTDRQAWFLIDNQAHRQTDRRRMKHGLTLMRP